jgi:iron complex transport system ATP-binding protein
VTLIATDIRVSLSDAPVLHGVGFRAEPGEVTAIVGPNGSGKTTLLRAMTQDLPYTGQIRLDGEDIGRLPGWRLAGRRAVLPQASRIAFPFTALEIVRLGQMAAAEPAPERRASEALERVGLAGFEGRFYQELSGGEQSRVQLARVLAQVWEPVGRDGPRWLFLDEPVASLDIGHQLEVMDLLADYAARGGGVVAIMHDLNLTAIYAYRVALLAAGRVAAQGTPAEVLTDATLSVAYGCPLRVNAAPRRPPRSFCPTWPAVRAGPATREETAHVSCNEPFRRPPENAEAFEAVWLGRDSHLTDMEGFVEFHMLAPSARTARSSTPPTRSGKARRRSAPGPGRSSSAPPMPTPAAPASCTRGTRTSRGSRRSSASAWAR